MNPPLRRIDVGAGRDQHPADLDVAPGRGAVERLDAQLVAASTASTSAPGVEQRPGGLGLAEERGEMERREPVGREGRRTRRILVEPLAQPVDVAERRRLEDVELRIDREQRVRRRRGRTGSATA